MTDKKAKILEAALERFARDGYNATSTSRIAREAGVSEGLIFRHFGNKKELLESLLADGEAKMTQILAPIIFADDPAEVIRATIQLPFRIDQEEYDYWRLQFQLKWQAEYHNPHKMQPLIDKLTWAFSQLNFPEPQKEARLLNLILDAIATAILREGRESQLQMQSFLLNKYQV